MSENLLEKLKQYGASDFYPLHMPGHKRRFGCFGDPFAIDITEIDGFDDLHHAQGILLEAQRRAARLYGAEETYYLVNGSTCGILAAVAASTARGGRILMARNSHKSCYHAAFLNDLRVTYLYPTAAMDCGIDRDISAVSLAQGTKESALPAGSGTGEDAGMYDVSNKGAWKAYAAPGLCGSIRPEDVWEALKREPDIQAVLLTSPTYDGVVSDVGAIAEAAHAAGAVLIVDEAHGAHFGMHPYFPERALARGADIVINSLHKTLPSLTQTALLHMQGDLADREKLKKYLDIYQTSSPSYVLMAGMDACVRLLEEQGDELFGAFAERLERMRGELRQKLRALRLVDFVYFEDGSEHSMMYEAGRSAAEVKQEKLAGTEQGQAKWQSAPVYDFDRSKVLISTEHCAMTGPQLAELLRRNYHLEPEMAAADYVTAIMTVADTQEGFDRLTAALLEIDAALLAGALADLPDNSDMERPGTHEEAPNGGRNEEVLTIRQAQESPSEPVPLPDSAGRVSAEFIYLYPPGIPLLVPGERISEELLERLARERKAGLVLRGMADESGGQIRVVRARGTAPAERPDSCCESKGNGSS